MSQKHFYSEGFYQSQWENSYLSAKEILPCVFEVYRPESMIDVGCGVGTWLAAAKELGIKEVLGMDGDWVQPADLKVDPSEFKVTDLEKNIEFEKTYDMAISLEVAEHLTPQRGPGFVKDLCKSADVVLFSAAVPGQGGINHVNERFQTYWKQQFESHGFKAFDCLRIKLWDNETVGLAYKQNIFLYARDSANLKLNKDELLPEKMTDLFHPILIQRLNERKPGIKETLKNLLRIPSLAIKRLGK